MTGPAYHGRTHVPGGTDPIPGVGGANLSSVYAHQSSHTYPIGSHGTTFGFQQTNDSSLYTGLSGSAPSKIAIATGGVYMTHLTILFGTSLGGIYSGVFEAAVDMFDSLNNAVSQLAGPEIHYAELYSTNGGDAFELTGTGIFNLDSTLTPPFFAEVFVNCDTAVATTGLALVVTRLSGIPVA